MNAENSFLNTTIRNWLSQTSELGYHLAFAQVLLSKGYAIVHNSRQNAFEQGKDIIAIDPENKPCAFQLKGGNISHSRWLSEVWPEIQELKAYTIEHPSIPHTTSHVCYLVTNGELEDTVRVAIKNLNNGVWKDNPLITITFGELLKDFVEQSGQFLPQTTEDYKTFLDLYFSNGNGLLDEEKFCSFIYSILRVDKDGLSKAERKRNIAAATLYAAYIAHTFYNADNYVGIVQVLNFLLAHIYAVVEKHKLDKKQWVDTVDLIDNEIMFNSKKLQDDISNGSFEKMTNSIWDGELGVFRRHLAITYVLTAKLSQKIRKQSEWSDIFNQAFLAKIQGTALVGSEGTLYFYILLFFLVSGVREDEAEKTLLVCLDTLIECNGRKRQKGLLPSPYYSIEQIIEQYLLQYFPDFAEPIDEDFTNRSYLIKGLVTLLVRENKRDAIALRWRDITHIQQEEFIPEFPWMNFLRRTSQGKNFSVLPNHIQSWAQLVDEAFKVDDKEIPDVLKLHLRYLPFLFLAHPHRIRATFLKFMHQAISKK